MSKILEVKNLTVKLDNEKIINNLSFTATAGEYLTIIGPNGSGKTVLLRALLGFISVFSGSIVWKKGVKIGYLPQGLTHLKMKNIPLSAEEFLSLKQIKSEKIAEFLDLVGIEDKNILKKQMGNLSGGQFQRILMIWALAGNPDILLFDEPTTGVDMKGEKTAYRLLHKFQQEKNLTILLITHDLNIVSKYSTDVLCMNRSNSCYGKPKEVLLPEMIEQAYDAPIKFYKHNH